MPDITNNDIIQAWNNVSQEAIKQHGDEGDFIRQHLLNPTLFRLLGDVQGRHILDAGCGQGYLCRLLARKGAIVTGIEPAQAWYKHALTREQTERLAITYLQADLSDLSVMENLQHPFDVVVANMVLMDIPDYVSAIHNCVAALRADGDFIFSITHPCFEEPAAAWNKKGYVEVREYFQERAIPSGYGHWFHHPLSSYLNLVIRAGCTLQEIIEPQLDQEIVQQYGEQHARNAYVPQFLIVHVRKE